MRRVAAALCAALGVLVGGGSAGADEPAVTLDGVLDTLGVSEVPADYVVLLDTSGSMRKDGRWSTAVASVDAFVAALRPADTVTLITFAADPVVLLDHGSAGAARAQVDRLPTPDGPSTDIGAAIAAGLSGLDRASAAGPSAVVILSDGEDTATGAYDNETSPAWRTLVRTGQRLADHVRGYAFPLGGTSGVERLGTVLPGTVELRLASGDLERFFGRLPERLRVDTAKARVAPDLGATVAAAWQLPPGQPDLTAPVPATLVLRSSCRALPLHLDGLDVRGTDPAGGAVAVTGLPDHLDLAPGAEARLPVQVQAIGSAGLWPPGGATAPSSVRLRVTGRVDTPWHTVLQNDFGTPPRLPPLDAAARVDGTVPAGLSWTVVVRVLIAAALLLLGVGRLWLRAHPRLRGTLELHDEDGGTWAQPLSRRTMTFTRPGPAGVSGRYVVRGRRDGAVAVAYWPKDHQPGAERVVAAAEWTDIGGVLLRYVPPQRRR